jgi:nitrile hydratase accessory protein
MTTPQLPPEAEPPRRNGEITFDAPWHSRAFGLAAVLAEAGQLNWNDFRDRLIEQIRDHGQDGVDDYYARWVDALAAQLVADGHLTTADLTDRTRQYHDHERDEVW